MVRRKEKLNNLDEILNSIWEGLKRGASDFNDPFHWPVLGTTGKYGCNLRTVILRRVILPDRILVCHTDARSTKVQEIMNFPKVSWLFYDPKSKVQLRIFGQAELHNDDQFADEQWIDTRVTSRLNYCTTDPPGTPIDKPSSGLPDFLRDKIPAFLESERGRENFMAIACRIDSIDWLILRALGNLRARFDWHGNRVRSTWLVP
jgi:hypothetical protein